MRAILAALVFLLPALSRAADERISSDRDNAILAQVLGHSYENGGYAVVVPMTTVGSLAVTRDRRMFARIKENVRIRLNLRGCDVDALMDKLVAANQPPAQLSLSSSPADGYLIDKDHKFDKYFKPDGGAWAKWYEENPKAYGLTRVSLPVEDPQARVVLVYMGRQQGYNAGVGHVIAFKEDQQGKLTEIGRVMVWVS